MLDVTATIVDLAVRGLPAHRRDWSGRTGSRRRTGGSSEAARRDGRPAALREACCTTGCSRPATQVLLSSLKKTFAARMAQGAERAVRGRHPGRLVPRPTGQGPRRLAGAPGSCLDHRRRLAPPALLGQRLHWAPVGIAAHRARARAVLLRRPDAARTGGGDSAVLAQARGFREYIRTAEAEQLALRGGSGHLQPLPALRRRVRRDRPMGPGVRSAGRGLVGWAASPTWYAGPTGWDPTQLRCLDERLHVVRLEHRCRPSSTSSSGGSGLLRRRLVGWRRRRRWRRLLVRESGRVA